MAGAVELIDNETGAGRVDGLTELRNRTGASLAISKRALDRAQGSIEKAGRILRRDGQAPTFKPRPGRPSSVSSAATARGYRFDAWATALARAVVASTSTRRWRSFTIEFDELGLWPVGVTAVSTDGMTEPVDPYGELDVSTFAIPDTFDDEDTVLEQFLDAHLENPALVVESFTLGDYFRLPGVFWRLALHDMCGQVTALMESANPGITCDVRIHDEMLKSSERQRLIDSVVRLTAEQMSDDGLFEAFVPLIYEEKDRQAELRRMRQQGLGRA